MMKNPYSEMIDLMRVQGASYNPPSIKIGTMLSSNVLKVGELQVNKRNLLINEYWVSKLNTGDSVAVLSTDDRQKFIILCKVV